MNVLDLFSGIGGFSLGLERAGMRTVAFCEIDPYCRAVLAKHWPRVPCYTDIRELTAARLAADGIGVDAICGGFPCQDISVAGKGAGLAGERSGLWRHYHRLIDELRPQYAILENVSALLNRGLAEVLGELAEIWYDAEWHCIPASYLGAPHRRDRIWIIAYRSDDRQREPLQPLGQRRSGAATDSRRHGETRSLAHASCELLDRSGHTGAPGRDEYPDCGETMANTNFFAGHEWRTGDIEERAGGRDIDRSAIGPHMAESGVSGLQASEREGVFGARGGVQGRAIAECGWWSTEPDVGRVAHGVPSRVDRLRSLGNAVVPQIPEIIGRAIMSHSRVPNRDE